jgi:hypothetical protein
MKNYRSVPINLDFSINDWIKNNSKTCLSYQKHRGSIQAIPLCLCIVLFPGTNLTKTVAP